MLHQKQHLTFNAFDIDVDAVDDGNIRFSKIVVANLKQKSLYLQNIT